METVIGKLAKAEDEAYFNVHRGLFFLAKKSPVIAKRASFKLVTSE